MAAGGPASDASTRAEGAVGESGVDGVLAAAWLSCPVRVGDQTQGGRPPGQAAVSDPPQTLSCSGPAGRLCGHKNSLAFFSISSQEPRLSIHGQQRHAMAVCNARALPEGHWGSPPAEAGDRRAASRGASARGGLRLPFLLRFLGRVDSEPCSVCTSGPRPRENTTSEHPGPSSVLYRNLKHSSI